MYTTLTLKHTARCSVCTAKAVYYYTADILPSSCSVPVVYTAESEKCICSIYCTSTALRSGPTGADLPVVRRCPFDRGLGDIGQRDGGLPVICSYIQGALASVNICLQMPCIVYFFIAFILKKKKSKNCDIP